MATDIQPGQWVNVKITGEPRSEAARKTMIRLFRMDPEVMRERRRFVRSRPVQWARRGGRLWGNRPPKLQAVHTTTGASYRIFASVDILRDLRSIARYVNITSA